MEQNIISPDEYEEKLAAVYNLMNKGEANLSPTELDKLEAMTTAVEKYEDEVMGLRNIILMT